MPSLYRNQWRLMWGIILLFFMLCVEVSCRISREKDIIELINRPARLEPGSLGQEVSMGRNRRQLDGNLGGKHE